MKYSIVLILTFLGTGCTTQQFMQSNVKESTVPTIYQNNKVGVTSIISNKALKSFKNDYAKTPKNKAFAQSTSGAWNWRSDRTSIEHAVTSALIACQRKNRKAEDLYPCKIIHINDSWSDAKVSED
ncbi:MAG: hypothetical protein COA99_11630 [Moraxellaceae bacterium]|nr:MAG: hypothetical protein COA99_11630 [Moraxellaceae bacterium]